MSIIVTRVKNEFSEQKQSVHLIANIIAADVRIDEDLSVTGCKNLATAFVNEMVKNLKFRFSDEVSQLCELQNTLKNKPVAADFRAVVKVLDISEGDLHAEWIILRRLTDDLSSQSAMIELATSPDKIAMFPCFARALRLLLLLLSVPQQLKDLFQH